MLGTCNCHEGWEGADCGLEMPCPNDCSNRGQCFDGRCVCDFGYHGNDCAIGGHLKLELFGPKCPNNCTGHGQCDGGDCVCELDWVGKECDLPALCPGNCSGHGLCSHQQCFCDPGYNGTSCAIYSGCLPGNGEPDCNGQGTCQHGQCFCTNGYDGDACEIDLKEDSEEDQMSQMDRECPNDGGDICSGHGRCFAGQCQCTMGYYGVMCNSISERDAITSNDVSRSSKIIVGDVAAANAGAATATNGTTEGLIGRSLLSLVEDGETRLRRKRIVAAPSSPNNRFTATSAKLLASNTASNTASVRATCPNGCSGHGDCDTSKNECLCASGWSGLDCSKQSQMSLEKKSGVVENTDAKTGKYSKATQ